MLLADMLDELLEWCMNWAERHERIFPWEFVQKEPARLGTEPGREGRREVWYLSKSHAQDKGRSFGFDVGDAGCFSAACTVAKGWHLAAHS